MHNKILRLYLDRNHADTWSQSCWYLIAIMLILIKCQWLIDSTWMRCSIILHVSIVSGAAAARHTTCMQHCGWILGWHYIVISCAMQVYLIPSIAWGTCTHIYMHTCMHAGTLQLYIERSFIAWLMIDQSPIICPPYWYSGSTYVHEVLEPSAYNMAAEFNMLAPPRVMWSPWKIFSYNCMHVYI